MAYLLKSQLGCDALDKLINASIMAWMFDFYTKLFYFYLKNFETPIMEKSFEPFRSTTKWQMSLSSKIFAHFNVTLHHSMDTNSICIKFLCSPQH